MKIATKTATTLHHRIFVSPENFSSNRSFSQGTNRIKQKQKYEQQTEINRGKKSLSIPHADHQFWNFLEREIETPKAFNSDSEREKER